MAEQLESGLFVTTGDTSMGKIKRLARENPLTRDKTNQESKPPLTDHKNSTEDSEIQENIHDLFDAIDRDDSGDKLERKVDYFINNTLGGGDLEMGEVLQSLEQLRDKFVGLDDEKKIKEVDVQIARFKAIIEGHAQSIVNSDQLKLDNDLEKRISDIVERLSIVLKGHQDNEQLQVDLLLSEEEKKILEVSKKLRSQENYDVYIRQLLFSKWQNLINNPDQFKNVIGEFLIQRMKVSDVLQSYVQLYEYGERQSKLNNIDGLDDESETEDDGGALIQLQTLNTIFEEVFDFVNIPSLVDQFFALEGNSISSRSVYRDGIEGKNDKERSTLRLLKKVFEDSDKTNTFFENLLQKDTLQDLDVEDHVFKLFNITDENKEDKKKKILDIKEKMHKAFEKALRDDIESAPTVVDLNLSRDVIQYILIKAETISK